MIYTKKTRATGRKVGRPVTLSPDERKRPTSIAVTVAQINKMHQVSSGLGITAGAWVRLLIDQA